MLQVYKGWLISLWPKIAVTFRKWNNHFTNNNTVPTFINTSRPVIMKQMHTFTVDGFILGPHEVVHIIYNFIGSGVQQAGIHRVAMVGYCGYVCQSIILIQEHTSVENVLVVWPFLGGSQTAVLLLLPIKYRPSPFLQTSWSQLSWKAENISTALTSSLIGNDGSRFHQFCGHIFQRKLSCYSPLTSCAKSIFDQVQGE